MANARQIIQRIGTAKNIAKITRAMEMVSASKMKRAQDLALSARPYAQALAHSLHLVASQNTEYTHPLLSVHDEGIDILVVVSTDRGLCGSLNQSLFKLAVQWHKDHPGGMLVTIGKRAGAFARFLGYDVVATFTEIPDKLTSSDLVGLSTLVTDRFSKKEFRRVDFLYTDFINTLSQRPKLVQLLPIQQIVPADTTLTKQEEPSEFLFEPDPREILDELLPFYVENTIFESILEAKASEHSARMVAMKNASDNAGELVKELQLAYNKSRQESITTELLDITTATLSLS